jgi:RNA polymerase sigma factor (sigma-70 family)
MAASVQPMFDRTFEAAAAQATPGPDDATIVEGLGAGQEWAADALYERVHDVVEQTLRRVLGPGDQELLDLVQEVFERLIVTLSDQRLNSATKLRGWAAAVATHVGVDVLRSRVRRRRLFRSDDGLPEGLGPIGPSLEKRLEARAEVERVRAVLARMPAEQVETLILHDVLGHSLDEIARLTSVSHAATQSRLTRGRRELDRRLNVERDTGGRP